MENVSKPVILKRFLYPIHHAMWNHFIDPSMKRILLFVVSATLIWSSCGSKKSTPSTGVSITISPTSVSVAGGATQQFMATVTGSTNTAVTWQVNGATGGDAINGTIDTNGLYKAPNVLPNTTTITITVISQADTTKTAFSSVTLTAPAVTISIAPASATVAAGATQQFTPTITVTGSSNNAINWSVNGVQGGDAIHGTIDANGLYTAPLSPPKASITVRATSQANTAFSASAPVIVQFGAASLNGTYVFFASRPDDSSGTGFFYRAGTLVANGLGNITGGINDASAGSAGSVGSGSYTVGTDGRGTLTFTDDGGTHKFSFALTSNTRGQLISFDMGPVVSGFIRKQDSTAAASAPNGAYVFALSGDNSSGTIGSAAEVGQLAFSSPTVTGLEDMNANGSVATNISVSGSSLSSPTNGRGTLQLVHQSSQTASQFAYYLIDASTLLLANIDALGTRVAGLAYAQSGTFSISSLGTSAYMVSGVTSGAGPKTYVQVGRFDTNSAGTIASGTFDTNTTANSQFGTSLPYTVASNGRGTFSNGTSNFIFWLAIPQGSKTPQGVPQVEMGVIMQADASASPVASGPILQQQVGIPSVTGGFALATSGTDSTGATAQATDAQITIGGFNQSTGTQDASPGLTSTAFQNGTVGISNPATERGNASIAGAGFTVYFVGADRF